MMHFRGAVHGPQVLVTFDTIAVGALRFKMEFNEEVQKNVHSLACPAGASKVGCRKSKKDRPSK